MQMPELTVEEIGTEELLPYANNAKIHTREQVDQIAKSIEEFGFNDPVAVWEGPGGLEIVEGHGRVMAAKKLNIEQLPVIRLDHLSDEQRRAYTHVHNQLTMNTGWDFETLEAELKDAEFDFEQYGFDLEQIINYHTQGERNATQTDLSDNVKDIFEVIVQCSCEADQERVYEELTAGGYECRVLTL